MTVKELKEFLKDIPDELQVMLVRSCREYPIFKYVKQKDESGTIEELQIS